MCKKMVNKSSESYLMFEFYSIFATFLEIFLITFLKVYYDRKGSNIKIAPPPTRFVTIPQISFCKTAEEG
jgi:hypothetical protein